MDLKQTALRMAMQVDQIDAKFNRMAFKEDEWPFVNVWVALQKEAIRFVQLALQEGEGVFQGVYFNLAIAYVKEANKMAEVVHALLILKGNQ